MNKKAITFFSIIFLIICSFTMCFASENMIKDAGNKIKDTIEDAGNSVENGIKNTENMITDSTKKMENEDKKIMSDTYNKMNEKNNTENGNYTATRTSANNATFMGMNATTWTWLILGVAAIAIIALVWYYSMQLTDIKNNGLDD